jgi:AcrR family transcriptional regulator
LEKSSTDVKSKSKSDETRARILDAAMDLFRRRGFEETTMREIATGAGVATGAAYYYFDSKDAIVLAFYDQAQQEMQPLLERALDASKDLTQRLRSLIEVKLRYFEPNRRLLGTLAAHADPEHPLSPFSAQTRGMRERDMQWFVRALQGSRIRVPGDFEPHLPSILWVYQMGLILFWIYDRSASQKRTHLLLDKSVAIVVRLIKLADLPLMRPLRRTVIDLVQTVAGEAD